MNWINGRPEDWTRWSEEKRRIIVPTTASFDITRRVSDSEIYEAGASAMLPAVLKWLKQYRKGLYPLTDNYNKPDPQFEFIIPEKDLKELEGE